MDFKKYFNKFKKLFFKFWRSDDSKISLIRDVFVALMLVLILLIALWGYTGQWFGAPMVAIESGSMEHIDPPFGRMGTIDAGDMVLLVNIDEKTDVSPYISKDNYEYGKHGDVVIYKPDGRDNEDQIIHRAMCWVEVETIDGQKVYTIEGTDVIRQNASEPLYLPELGIRAKESDKPTVAAGWTNSGFITKGDNPNTNPTCDQIGGITSQPIKIDWISGKARGEIPWIGTINLFFNDMLSGGESTVRNVHEDSIICLFILIIFLISIPVILDIYSYIKSKDEKEQK